MYMYMYVDYFPAEGFQARPFCGVWVYHEKETLVGVNY
jgi:hypothetical protein